MYRNIGYSRTFLALILLAIVSISISPGCKKKKSSKTSNTAAAQSQAIAPLKVDDSLGAFPEDALIVAGVSSLSNLKDFFDTASAAVDDPVDFETVILPNLLKEIGINSPRGIDLDRPVYVVLWNPKKFTNTTLIVPLKSKDDFEAALGDNKTPSTAGADLLIKTAFRDLHALHMGNYIAISQDLSPLTEKRAFLEKINKSFMPKEALHAIASIKNFNRIYAAELQEGRNTILNELTNQLKNDSILGGSNAAAIPPTMLTAYADELDKVVNFLKSVGTLDLRSKVNKDRMVVEIIAETEKGSELNKFLEAAAKRDKSILKSLPANTSLVAASFLGKHTPKGIENQGIEILTATLDLTPEEKARFNSAITGALKNITGDSAFALYSQNQFPLSIMAINMVNDGPQHKKALGEIADIIRSKAQNYMLKQGGGPQLDFSSWATAVTQLDQTVRPFGVGLELVEQSSLVGLRIKGNYDASPFIPPNLKPILKKHVGEKLELAIGLENKAGDGGAAWVIAFGPSAIDDTVGVLERKSTFTNAGFEASKKRGARNSFMNFWLDIGATLRAFAPLVRDLGPMIGENAAMTQNVAASFETFPLGVPVTFSGGGEKTNAHVVLDLPFSPLRALRKLGQ